MDRVKLDDAARSAAVRELEGRGAELARAVASLTAERDWLREQEGELAWTRECLTDREAHLAEANKALRDAGAALSAALAERDGLRATLDAREEELLRLTDDHAALDRHFEALEEERRRTARAHEAGLAELELARGAHDELLAAHEALREHERWLRDELVRLVRKLAGADAARADAPDALAPALVRAFDGLRALERELAWRAAEMDGAAHDVNGLGERLLRGPLLRRVRSWREGVAGGEA
ncbi:MAG: hypothetical protein H6828_00685 [Planctomycetes bacterium]|nr:hypothetical protein [Planctomycetota bacterium]